MLEGMPHTSQRLSSLRQEISDLRTLNAGFLEKKKKITPFEQSALELRAHRLLEIKEELNRMLNKPDAAAWW